MDLFTIIVALLGLFMVFWVVGVYNRFVTLKHNVKESWSNIDVILRQRNEELPKLVDTCRQYMSYETEALDRVTRLREQGDQCRQKGDVEGVSSVEGMLGGALTNLLARAEAYPDLKANDSFQRLLARISTLQDTVSDRREFYNESVNINNIRREHFPDLIIARLFRFKAFPLFEISSEEREKQLDINQMFG